MLRAEKGYSTIRLLAEFPRDNSLLLVWNPRYTRLIILIIIIGTIMFIWRM